MDEDMKPKTTFADTSRKEGRTATAVERLTATTEYQRLKDRFGLEFQKTEKQRMPLLKYADIIYLT